MQVQSDDIKIFASKLADLEEMVMQAKRVPLSNMCMVDRERTLGIISDLIHNSPKVFQHCQEIVGQESVILAEANKKAQATMESASKQAGGIVSDARQKANHRMQEAQSQSQDALNKAQMQAAAMIREAQENAQNMVKDAEARAAHMVSQQEIVARATMEA